MTALDVINRFDCGAKFYNAELHIHSFGASVCVSDSALTIENIFKMAVANGISILSITDHNTDANIQNAITEATKFADRLLFIPGLEITTTNGHILAYFSIDNYEQISNLLGIIRLKGNRGEQDTHTQMSMAEVIREINELGGIAVAAHIDRAKTGFETLTTGYPQWKKDIILHPGLYGLEYDDNANIEWYSEDDQGTQGAERRNIYRQRRDIPEISGRINLARLKGSDAHTFADLNNVFSKSGSLRIKMSDLCFASFKTALVDAEARVRIKDDIPKSYPRILGMHIDGGFLDNVTYNFSNNLNCFIGGRGTGKSTSIQSLSFGFGLNDDFSNQDNCPNNIVIYCEDQNGIQYRYERSKGNEAIVKAKNNDTVTEVPKDVFKIEFYSQGELSEVSKNPLENPEILQEFLDTHLDLRNLHESVEDLVLSIQQNSSQLIPLEIELAKMPKKRKSLDDIENKLKIAEEGKLKQIVEFEKKLSSEKSLVETLKSVQDMYQKGLSLRKFQKKFDELKESIGETTNTKECNEILAKLQKLTDSTNSFLEKTEISINEYFRNSATEMKNLLDELKAHHEKYDEKLEEKRRELREKGLSVNLQELHSLLSQKSQIISELQKINSNKEQHQNLKEQRNSLLTELIKIRTEIIAKRKSPLHKINGILNNIIKDYTVFLRYDDSGIIANFKQYILDNMHGTHFPDELARKFCESITPDKLVEIIKNNEISKLCKIPGLNAEWAKQIIDRFSGLKAIHELEVLWKPPLPTINVKTKGQNAKLIPINQLSDGQKHTILLTIAIMSESNTPLIIDQPEDDLDNAFIFTSVVSTLRRVKERRQIFIVTHNANIAVLGDAELILPMRQEGYRGIVFDRGSIDKKETQLAVQNILEGGELAFRKRKEIYGH